MPWIGRNCCRRGRDALFGRHFFFSSANPSKINSREASTLAAMLRQFLRLLLLLAVFNHGAALPGTWQAAGVATGEAAQQHALMHWLAQHHHHHDDGGVHKHSGADSAQHLQADNLLQSPALMSDFAGAADTDMPPIPPAPLADAHPKTAFLALPERPPRGLS
jgi:hypothetical protein